MRPKVFTIILNWNGHHDTMTCLNSIKKSTYTNNQVVVIDNGSSEESIKAIEHFDDFYILIKTGVNLGFSGGCNVGINYALEQHAEYIWLLNNDTEVDSNALLEMVSKAESDTRIGVVGSVIHDMSTINQIQAWGGGWVSKLTGRAGHYFTVNDEPHIDYITGTSMLLRASAVKDVGLFDEKSFFMYWEDVDLCCRLRKAGWKLAVANDSKIFHKKSASVGNNSPLLDYYYNSSAIRFYLKNYKNPFIPILVGTSGRLLKRLLSRDKNRIVSTLKGSWVGLTKP